MPNRFLPGAVQRPAHRDAGPVSGNLPRVVWHSTETDPANTTAATIANNLDRESFSVHLVWHPVSGAIVQAIPADRYGRGLKGSATILTNRMGNPCIQIEVVGFAAHPFTNGPCKGLDRIMDWLRSFGIPDVFPSGVAGNRDRHTWQKAGHFTHAVTPDNDHHDPGLINPKRLFDAGGHLLGNGHPHPSGHREHVVKSGETLSGIAKSEGVPFDRIKALNPILFNAAHHNGSLIHPGEVVHLS